MVIFKSELDLINALRDHDKLVFDCAERGLDFWTFTELYNDFYAYYALDGHESDDEEQQLLDKYDDRIELHRRIISEVLSLVCADEDAEKESYIQAGRFGSKVAQSKLKEIVDHYRATNPNKFHL